MILNIVIGVVTVLVSLIVIVLIVAAFRPNSIRIHRALTIQSPPAPLYALINDFHQWTEWSPWEKLDPNLQRTYAGPPQGVGSIYEWTGNDKVGSGRMEILESTAPSNIQIKLDFLKPFEAHNHTDFTLESKGDSTTVNWTMTGQSPFMMKVMGLFMNLDKIVGAQFEEGLNNLKAKTEAK